MFRNLLLFHTAITNYQEERLRRHPTHNFTKEYPAINLTKEVRDPCSENCKTLRKEKEEDTNKGKHISRSQIERIYVYKCAH